jgi:hypothetical protein
MEAVFRTIGRENSADPVYLTQRRRSLKYDWEHQNLGLKALLESLYGAFFNSACGPFEFLHHGAVNRLDCRIEPAGRHAVTQRTVFPTR